MCSWGKEDGKLSMSDKLEVTPEEIDYSLDYFNIDDSYTVSASCVEEAKKNILVMIEDGMNAAINKKLDSSSAFVTEAEGGLYG